MRKNLESAERLTDDMLGQLRYCNFLLITQGEFIQRTHAPCLQHLPEAIDVILEPSECAPLDSTTGQSPMLLRFTAGWEKLHQFTAIHEDTLYRQPPQTISPAERVTILSG